MNDSVPTIKELTKLRVVDLKQRLASLGISTTGLKAELVKRLHDALMEQEGQTDYQDYQDNLPSEEYNPPQIIHQPDPLQQEKELFEQQKEALAFEQVRLLEEEKARQEVHRMELGKQQQQMLVDHEQQQQLMAETQQQLLARQDVEMIERGKQQQHILMEMKKNEEMAHREMMMAAETQRILAQQEEQRMLAAQQEEQRMLVAQEEQQRMLAAQEEQQRMLQEEQQRLFMQQEEQRMIQEEQHRMMAQQEEQQRMLAQQEEQQRMMAQQDEQRRMMAQQEEQRRMMAQQEEQRRIMAQQEEQRRLLAQQEEQRRILAQQEEQRRILAQQEEQRRIIAQQEEQRRLLAQQEEQKMAERQQQLLQQQKMEERQAVMALHQMQQPQFNPMNPENVGRPIENVSLGQILPIEPAMTANIAAATQVARRIPHSGPQCMIIPLNPVMTSSGLAQPITTMAGPSFLRAVSQPSVVVGSNIDSQATAQPVNLIRESSMQVPVIQAQLISTSPITITTITNVVSQANMAISTTMSRPITMAQQIGGPNQGHMSMPPSSMAANMPMPPISMQSMMSQNLGPRVLASGNQQGLSPHQMQPPISPQRPPPDNAPLLPTPNLDSQNKPMVPISAPSHQPMQQNIMEPIIPHSVASMPISSQPPLISNNATAPHSVASMPVPGQQPMMGSNSNNAPLLPMPPMMPPPPPPMMMMPPNQAKQTQPEDDGPLLPIPVDMQGNEIPPNSMVYNQDKEIVEGGEYPLPSAIEKVLALKNVRAQESGLNADGEMNEKAKEEEKKKQKEKEAAAAPPKILKPLVEVDEDDADDEEQPPPAEPTAPVSKQPKESKNKRKKMKKKRARQRKMEQKYANENGEKENEVDKEMDDLKSEVEIDYVPDTMEPKDPLYFQFLRIFEKFKLQEPEKPKPELTEEQIKEIARQEEIMNRLAERKKPADIDEKDDDDDDKKEEEKPKLSKRKLKKLSRMTVAELKQRVSRPELVEMHDVTAKDPVLLLHLKAARNSVPVPRHWCFKRKYLQGKRGIEKPPFLLPDFIRKTGIMEMRQALQEKEEAKTMKAKMRERVRPKMGKIDIDYQKLHDAFFKWQIKPKMTIHGDLYYEGKEFETRLKEKKPGDLSEELRIALGMPTGPNQNKCPPPWLIAMQRYGPPPSYPNLKIPGLNAPIPDGCSFGYHAGGWGKPPVDEMGRPLYGDVFNTQSGDPNYSMIDEEVDRTLWGELESESSEESEEESEEEEEEEKVEDETGLVTPAEGLVTPSGLSSVPAGMETPDMIELRKRKIEAEMEGGETPALYTILPERQPERIGASMMGSTHIYDVTAAMQAPKARGVTGAIAGLMPPQGVEVTLDPSELEMDSAAMAARYEQTVREQQSQLAKEDLSDMVAEHAARQKNKRKKQQQQDTGKTAKKYKEFKF